MQDDPEYILNEYAGMVKNDTEGEFYGMVVESVNSATGEVSYAFYIVAPKLNDYMYRLMEATLQNLILPYPLELKLFAQDPSKHRSFRCLNAEEFKEKLEEFIQSPITGNILGHLDRLIKIKGVAHQH